MAALRNRSAIACISAALGIVFGPAPAAQGPVASGRLATIAAGSPQALRQWDPIAQAMLRSGELRVRQVREDTQLPGRRTERADQYYRGVRVFGADISRQIDEQGIVLSLFGNVYADIELSTNPSVEPAAVRTTVSALTGLEQPATGPDPELVILPIDDGGSFRLAWRLRAVTDRADIFQYFIDAQSGVLLRQYSDRQSQSTVGRATGVLGDSKKISVSGGNGTFSARDLLRPPVVETDDMKGDPL